MGIRVELFDTDLARVRALVGSRDKRASKELKRRGLSRDRLEAAKALIMDGGYDHADSDHREGFVALAELQSHGRGTDARGLSDYGDLSDWLRESGEPGPADLAWFIYRGRDLVTGTPGGPEDDNWVGYLTLGEVRTLLAGFERIRRPEDWRAELIDDELGPFLAELAASGRDLCAYAT